MKKNKSLSRKILISTVFEECRIEGDKQRKRAIPQIFDCLDEMKRKNLILGYTTGYSATDPGTPISVTIQP
jgi:hypothetical protein